MHITADRATHIERIVVISIDSYAVYFDDGSKTVLNSQEAKELAGLAVKPAQAKHGYKPQFPKPQDPHRLNHT
jgi:hypothetical protein